MSALKSAVAVAATAVVPLLAALAAGSFSSRAHAAPPADSQYGTIKGRLVWGGAAAPKPELIKTDKDPQVCATKPHFDPKLVVDPKTNGIADALAYLPAPKGKNPEAVKALLEKEPKAVIDQKNCEFIPHTTAMHKDQPIVFKSSDPVGHNAHYTGFTNGSKNVALSPNGSSESKLVAEKRPLTLACDIHPWMNGNIMVFDHTFFAVTKPDGTFEIHGVPAGTQNLIVWHEKVGYVTEGGSKGKAVNVPAGGVVDVGDIKLDPAKLKK